MRRQLSVFVVAACWAAIVVIAPPMNAQSPSVPSANTSALIDPPQFPVPFGIVRTVNDLTGRSTSAATNMTWHGGPIQHTQKVFTIFWAGPGGSFPIDYQMLNNQFVQDLNGSSYYAIASQYTDGAGPISTTVVYGGTWLDTVNPFPFSTIATPSYTSLLDEVNRAKAANPSWTSDANSYFQVYTPSGYLGGGGYCGFHYWSTLPIGLVLLPWSNSIGSCFPGSPYPNGSFSDAAISVSAHEIMETVTNPQGTGWYYVNGGGEIGDLCAWVFGARAGDGSNLTINGH